MRRFFIANNAVNNDVISITGTEARHITQVLRLQPGQQIECFTKDGTVYTATLSQTSRSAVTADINHTKASSPETEIPYPLTLVQGLLKGKKMDLIVQKATELGVNRLMTITTRYCENRGPNNRQQERWQRIMIEACKQSHRTNPMAITEPLTLNTVDFSYFTHRLLAWENEQQNTLAQRLQQKTGPICLCIGPEGGWHSEEVEFLYSKHFTSFSLGENILRSETASIASISIIKYLTEIY